MSCNRSTNTPKFGEKNTIKVRKYTMYWVLIFHPQRTHRFGQKQFSLLLICLFVFNLGGHSSYAQGLLLTLHLGLITGRYGGPYEVSEISNWVGLKKGKQPLHCSCLLTIVYFKYHALRTRPILEGEKMVKCDDSSFLNDLSLNYIIYNSPDFWSQSFHAYKWIHMTGECEDV